MAHEGGALTISEQLKLAKDMGYTDEEIMQAVNLNCAKDGLSFSSVPTLGALTSVLKRKGKEINAVCKEVLKAVGHCAFLQGKCRAAAVGFSCRCSESFQLHLSVPLRWPSFHFSHHVEFIFAAIMLLNRAAYELPIAESVYVPSIVSQLSVITAANVYTCIEPALIETAIKWSSPSSATTLLVVSAVLINECDDRYAVTRATNVRNIIQSIQQQHDHFSRQWT
ncbi:unnamed protein product [Toxocara canis]|uniref:ThrE domain-containing protein n=1 Tax=Toxocara canis TaxID=6265 RepID=A0A183V0D8_TOXCA|nr:unnamed protein product [Toxocara canis]